MTGPDPCHEICPTHGTACSARTQRMGSSEAWDRTKSEWSKRKKNVNVVMLDDILLHFKFGTSQKASFSK